jgi:hypothetical protein
MSVPEDRGTLRADPRISDLVSLPLEEHLAVSLKQRLAIGERQGQRQLFAGFLFLPEQSAQDTQHGVEVLDNTRLGTA